MKKTMLFSFLAVASIIFFTQSCKKDGTPNCNCDASHLVVTSSVYAKGLNNPRGLKFGPDGLLYVAEGGVGGSNPVSGCQGVPAPVGPYTGNTTGSRILKIERNGDLTVVADNLPSSQTAPTQGSLVSGVGDIAFINNTLYGVLAGAGCSHGVPSIPNGIIKVLPNKQWTLLANLSQFQMSHPVAN